MSEIDDETKAMLNAQGRVDVDEAVARFADFAAEAGAEVPQLPRTRETADQVIALAGLDSTMVLSRRMIADGGLPLATAAGEPRMAVMCVEAQTAGHGRLGRKWADKAGASFLVNVMTALPRGLVIDPQFNGWFTIEAGLAMLEAIRDAMGECGARLIDPAHELALKWPNDIFYDGHKLGGILTELVELPEGASGVWGADGSGASGGLSDRMNVGVVFGIGMNLDLEAALLPTPISTSLQLIYAPLPDPRELRDAITAGLVRHLRERLARLVAAPDTTRDTVYKEMQAVCWTLGRQVEAKFTDGSRLQGRAVALNADASLTIEDESGARHVVQTADVGVIA